MKTIRKTLGNGSKSVWTCEMFNSINELQKALDRPDNGKYGDRGYTMPEGREGFYGVKTFDEAIDLLHKGYDVAVKASKADLKANRVRRKTRSEIVNDFRGFTPNVPRYCANVPKTMQNMRFHREEDKVIDVHCMVEPSCIVTEDSMTKVGTEVMRVIMALENDGYRINLYADTSSTSSDAEPQEMMSLKIKSADRPLDIKRLSFTLCHVGFTRVLGFKYMDTCPHTTHKSGRGSPITFFDRGGVKADDVVTALFGDHAIMVDIGGLAYDLQKHGIKRETIARRIKKAITKE